MHYVYILFSEKKQGYYIGQTQNLKARLGRHNSGSEAYTKPYVPWKIVWHIHKDTRSEALILEAKLKNLNRERLLAFIEKYK
ncbi:putative endonuclease [Flavobacteriaceae bacterium MAR_2010_188]|nr:putative endonuclease [Flavobacteriaceae bacterium MAR_2010_188]